ncbi:argininosuccinate synthase-related protein [Rhodoferax sp. GW822-FHT02A01]|uniref:argininosuccinate synthase-related protein n=1 Tax=Rhodoferax sp. GW822-FHT02A01 TaxID=3141537 RepID=UPI00315C963F
MISKRIRSFADMDVVASHSRHILTLFSGGLDSSYALKELARRNCKVTAMAVDVGDGVDQSDLKSIADHFGADLEVVDAREEFVNVGVIPAIRAQAKYLGIYPISSSLTRPLIAASAVRTAKRLGCDAVIHTANQSQNSLRRLNGAISQLGFGGWYGTPYEFSALSREEKIAGLAAAGLTRFQARGISGDANLWVREYESGSLDNPEAFWVPDSLYQWTAATQSKFGASVQIRFEGGRPVAVNGKRMPTMELVEQLNYHVGSFGIGRYSGLEHLDQGEKVLEVREAPAATILMDAYRHLETACLEYEVLREKASQEQLWVREAIEGRWYGKLRESAEQFIDCTAQQVSGTVGFQLRGGAADVCSIVADVPLYLTDRDAWEKSVAKIRGSNSLQIPEAMEVAA